MHHRRAKCAHTTIKWGKCVENDKNESFVSSSNLMFGIFVFLKTLVNDLFWNAFWENLEAHALELWNMIWLYSWENSERISRLFVSLTNLQNVRMCSCMRLMRRMRINATREQAKNKIKICAYKYDHSMKEKRYKSCFLWKV